MSETKLLEHTDQYVCTAILGIITQLGTCTCGTQAQTQTNTYTVSWMEVMIWNSVRERNTAVQEADSAETSIALCMQGSLDIPGKKMPVSATYNQLHSPLAVYEEGEGVPANIWLMVSALKSLPNCSWAVPLPMTSSEGNMVMPSVLVHALGLDLSCVYRVFSFVLMRVSVRVRVCVCNCATPSLQPFARMPPYLNTLYSTLPEHPVQCIPPCLNTLDSALQLLCVFRALQLYVYLVHRNFMCISCIATLCISCIATLCASRALQLYVYLVHCNFMCISCIATLCISCTATLCASHALQLLCVSRALQFFMCISCIATFMCIVHCNFMYIVHDPVIQLSSDPSHRTSLSKLLLAIHNSTFHHSTLR